MALMFEWFAEPFGERQVLWTASPPNRSTSTYRFLPARERPYRLKRLATLSLMFLPGPGDSATPPAPLAVPTEAVKWADTTPPAEADNRSLIVLDRGDEVTVQAGDDGIRFLLVSGKPLEEPVAWYGPIVMNTQEQLQQAFTELQEGTFLKETRRE